MINPVLVAGAGPVGLTAAMELARYGVPVRIVDQAPTRTDKSKAIAVWLRTLELLDRAGCADCFVAAGTRMRAVNIRSGHDRIARVPLDEAGLALPQLLIIPQSESERLLEAHLERYGVRVERSVALTGFADTGEGVTATLRRADGTSETVEARWLVACDGAHSLVRHTLGLAFAGDTLAANFVLADVRVGGLGTPGDELAMFWHQDGILAFFPFSHGRYRIIGDLGDDMAGDPDFAVLQAIVRQRTPPGVTLSDPAWLSTFRINERMVPEYRVGRVFLAGDAAHVHSPAGGQGMNTGMQDAFNLAWKLALVHGGLAGQDLLDSYSPERSGIAKQVLAESGRLTRVATVRNPLVQTLRNFAAHHLLGLPSAQHVMAARLSETTIRYPASRLIADAAGHIGGPAPGERIIAGTPFGSGNRPRFALMARLDDQVQALVQDHAALLEPDLRDPPDAAGAWLVRPDGYVAARDRAGTLHAIREVLDWTAGRLP